MPTSSVDSPARVLGFGRVIFKAWPEKNSMIPTCCGMHREDLPHDA